MYRDEVVEVSYSCSVGFLELAAVCKEILLFEKDPCHISSINSVRFPSSQVGEM